MRYKILQLSLKQGYLTQIRTYRRAYRFFSPISESFLK
uniref:Uncharacterized protein n=1 Tax=Anguilla anguilla TaxID=7936 RepID=A0A0E9PV58_ANGAN